MYTRTPLIQLQRSLAAQAAVKRSGDSPGFQIKKLENGLTVACLDNGGKLTTIGVVSKAGCRYENYEEAGLTHAIRAAFGLSSSKFTGFGIMRNIQQAGACVEASGNRDFLIYSTQFVRGFKNEHVLDYMFDAVSNPQFRRWEIPAAHEKVKVQVAEMEPHVRATELLHKAAYRQGLGNSLYSPEHMIGKHICSGMDAFHKKHVTSDRTALVGLNIDFNHLCEYASSLELEKGAGPSTSAKYFGGELRHDMGGNIAHVAIAAESGNPITNVKEAAANYMLKFILGNGQLVKYGSLGGKLGKSLPAEGLHAVAGFMYGYIDASLLGAHLATDAATAGENVTKVAQALRSVNVTEQEFQAAKKAAQIEVSEMALNPQQQVENLGSMAMAIPDMATPESSAELMNSVTLADVQAAAKKLSNAKLSMAAVGNLANVPHVESL